MAEQGENKELENCLDKLAEAEKTAQEYLDNWKRERAEFLNYKKAEDERMAEFARFSSQNLILEILEISDDLEIAWKHSRDPESIKQISGKIEKFLSEQGVKRIEVKGQKFDPALHEALEVEDENAEKIEEIRGGYQLNGKVIRPARVKIIK